MVCRVDDDGIRELLRNPETSYSSRETPAAVLRNRIGVTSLLFSAAMGLSYLLGRPRR